MRNEDFPALFQSSDASSNAFQRKFLLLVRSEYVLLILASIFSLSMFSSGNFYLLNALIFIATLTALLVRTLTKPEQDWYKCRALAESVKTLTWRYMMRAAPFQDGATRSEPRSELRENLERVFRSNAAIAEKIDENWSSQHQITEEMERVRDLSFDERKAFYTQHRIQDQRGWYGRKARWNRKMARNWSWAAGAAYVIACILVISRVRFPEHAFWPIEPFIVIASSIIGWTQIKKFNELSAAYTVTAHEIGFVQAKLDPASSEEQLSDVVNEAELAFSREHTLWIARQAH